MPHRSVFLSLTAALLLAGVPVSTQAAEPFTLYTEEYAPYSWLDRALGKPVGMSVDIVSELMARAGVAAKAPAIVPWARGLAQTMLNPHSCLFSTTRTAEREASFTWIGPIARNEWVMFARRADHIVLHSLADARPHEVGVLIGDALNPFLAENKLTLRVAPAHRLNALKLQAGRIQLWATGRLPALHLMRELGISDVESVFNLAQHEMYLACHKDLDKADVVHLNDVLRGMYRDGTVQRIYGRWGYDKDAPRAEAGGR